MQKKYPEYKKLDLSAINKEVLNYWKENNIFEKSVSTREGNDTFTFYEGPPSANGMPGIHHVMARTIKDIFCRYQTLQGKQVHRKAGWDTHGLPVELSVEKELGITKEDIGTKISVEEYNQKCRENVMKYKHVWEDLTDKMGYWVDMSDPYVTYDNKYIESVWYLLSQMYKKDFLYKGYTIQPYSPAAGTGLSTHELNQPGTYRDVSDTTVTAQFKIVADDEKAADLRAAAKSDVYFLAWTTTPWTLPSNTALAVGKKIDYVLVNTYNQYTGKPVSVVLAKDLFGKHFPEKNAELSMDEYKAGDKKVPFELVKEYKGADLEGIRYEQLLPYAQPTDGDAFRVIIGDYVTTEDGTGIVHIAPSFGADDNRVAKMAGIGSLTLVDLQGKFTQEMGEFAGEYVKEEYIDEADKPEDYKNVDIRIAIKLKEENLAFKVEKYVHSYPHCWRTDKPVLYYPLDSWFVKTTSVKQRMMDLNKTINWKPASTGTGRFGNWLENLVDWNLSRSRFWGIPIPIWTSEDRTEQKCIGSAEELRAEIEKAVAVGFMDNNPLADFTPGDFSKENYETFDFHKPYVDRIILVSDSGKPMKRESDLIDVWFDSGSMPYAQLHYPFENKEEFENNYPADFIAEGVDQTRGWFFTLHAIATILFDSVAYKNVVSNGLVLDKNGQKMSKRLGNAVDAFDTIETYGSDATRWYMITNAQPWDNLKFDLEGIKEVQRKFFGTLYNTYSFFALYANIDGFTYAEEEMKLEDRPELDRWILSELNTLIKEVNTDFSNYEPTGAGRKMEYFLEKLSNWYVRLSRRRFWKGSYGQDKVSAYQTLYHCLTAMAKMISPIAPFFSERLFADLNGVCNKENCESVHLSLFPEYNKSAVDKDLEIQMDYARQITSLVLSIRKKENIKVRQPLNKIQIPTVNADVKAKVEAVRSLILSEVNVKQLEFVTEEDTQLVKNMKLNFRNLGVKYGKLMKSIQQHTGANSDAVIKAIETEGVYNFDIDGEAVSLMPEDVEIIPVDIPGWKVATSGIHTVALDVTIDDDLREEGIARELVNRIQNMRKEIGLEVTDKIELSIQSNEQLDKAISNNLEYICNETLAEKLNMVEEAPSNNFSVEFDDIITYIALSKI